MTRKIKSILNCCRDASKLVEEKWRHFEDGSDGGSVGGIKSLKAIGIFFQLVPAGSRHRHGITHGRRSTEGACRGVGAFRFAAGG